MKTKLFGFDLEKENVTKLTNQQELYNIEFQHFTDEDALRNELDNKLGLVVVAIDLGQNHKQKYKLSASISKQENVVVIFISDEKSSSERVRWVTYGAFLYILKPYQCEELIARTLYLSSKYQPLIVGTSNLYIDLRTHQIFYFDQYVKTPPKLFYLMLYLVENDGKIVKRDDLMSHVFGENHLTDRSIDNFIKELRKKFAPNIVRTVRGVGYIYDSHALSKEK